MKQNKISILILSQLVLLSVVFGLPTINKKKQYERDSQPVNEMQLDVNEESKLTCRLPVFLRSNSDFYNKVTGRVNLKDVKRLLRKLELQMVSRYGKHEVENGLMNLDESNFKFDEFDLIYFSLKSYTLCLQKMNMKLD
jgi:hypothetical protein